MIADVSAAAAFQLQLQLHIQTQYELQAQTQICCFPDSLPAAAVPLRLHFIIANRQSSITMSALWRLSMLHVLLPAAIASPVLISRRPAVAAASAAAPAPPLPAGS